MCRVVAHGCCCRSLGTPDEGEDTDQTVACHPSWDLWPPPLPDGCRQQSEARAACGGTPGRVTLWAEAWRAGAWGELVVGTRGDLWVEPTYCAGSPESVGPWAVEVVVGLLLGLLVLPKSGKSWEGGLENNKSNYLNQLLSGQLNSIDHNGISVQQSRWVR